MSSSPPPFFGFRQGTHGLIHLYLIVAKRKTLFDDRPVEISVCIFFPLNFPFLLSVLPPPPVSTSRGIFLRRLEKCGNVLTISAFCLIIVQELTYIIKQDIAGINKQIASLQAHLKQQQARSSKHSANKLVDEHHTNVVMLLQSKLAATSMAFKDVLEVRTQNMKESKDRTELFMSSTSAAASQAPTSAWFTF